MRAWAISFGVAALLVCAQAQALPAPVWQQCWGVAHASPARVIASCTEILNGGGLQRRDLPDILDDRGNAYIKAGKFPEALTDFSAAIAIAPRDADAFAGRCLARAAWNHELQIALADCGTALEIRPGDAGALYLRGLIKRKTGDASAEADIAAAKAKNARLTGLYAEFGLTP